MSNITNQMVAIVATLVGFVAHDVLSERQATEIAATPIAATEAVDTIVTRAIDLDGASLEDMFETTTRAEREVLRAPASRVSAATAPAHMDVATNDTELAVIRIDAARSVAPAQQADLSALR